MKCFVYVILTVLLSACSAPNAASVVNPSPTDYDYPLAVGTPVIGDLPHSDQPLPTGIVNGDIIGCHLFWFIWENTKSRIWFPTTAPGDVLFKNPFFADLADGPDATGRLIGHVNSSRGWAFIATTTQDWKQTVQVYIVDEVKRIKYPVRHKEVTGSKCLAIPTAAGIQYDPVLEGQ